MVGRIALITGVRREIATAIARAFCGEGARVVLTDIGDEFGQTVAAERGAQAEYQRLDVRLEVDWVHPAILEGQI